MKRFISLLLIISVLFSLAACGTMNDTEATTAKTSGHFPVTVTDQAGREITIKSEPQRLLSSYYITTSLIMALDLEDRLVGVEDNAGLRPIYGLSSPHILDLPNIGTVKELDLEKCAALEPDLAILPMKLKNSADSLEALGIPVIFVNPESQELLMEMIRLVGTATNTLKSAESLIAFLENQEIRLNESLSDVQLPRVYLAGNSGLLQTAGNAMYQSDMIHLAGGKNVADSITDTYWAATDYEQLLAWDPEYIILASNAQYTVDDVMADPNLSGCTAILNANVYQIPSDAEAWDSPVPGSILGAFWLASILHPEQITDTDCTAVMDEYYETFYQFTYSEK